MMIIHRTGSPCPLHGEPNPHKGRVRSYVGTNPERQTAAREAIAALPIQAQLERDAERCLRVINRTFNLLRSLRELLDQLQKDLAP